MGKERFVLKEDHIKLMSRMWVQWQDCEYGAPEIDPKRPYGNSGEFQIFMDMCLALGIEPETCGSDDDEFGEVQAEMLRKLHLEIEDALQIVLVCTTFETGLYEKDKYNNLTWKKATP